MATKKTAKAKTPTVPTVKVEPTVQPTAYILKYSGVKFVVTVVADKETLLEFNIPAVPLTYTNMPGIHAEVQKRVEDFGYTYVPSILRFA